MIMSFELRSMVGFTLNLEWKTNKQKERRHATLEDMLRMSDHSYSSPTCMASVGGTGTCIFEMRLQIRVPTVTHAQFNRIFSSVDPFSFLSVSSLGGPLSY